MHRNDIIIFACAMVFLAFRLYQRYKKKENEKSGTDTKSSQGSGFSSSSKDDDYEPYSKK